MKEERMRERRRPPPGTRWPSASLFSSLTDACVCVQASTSLTAPVGTMPKWERERVCESAVPVSPSAVNGLSFHLQLTPALAINPARPGQQGPQHGQHGGRRVQAGQPGGDGQGAVFDDLTPNEQRGCRVERVRREKGRRPGRGRGRGGGVAVHRVCEWRASPAGGRVSLTRPLKARSRERTAARGFRRVKTGQPDLLSILSPACFCRRTRSLRDAHTHIHKEALSLTKHTHTRSRRPVLEGHLTLLSRHPSPPRSPLSIFFCLSISIPSFSFHFRPIALSADPALNQVIWLSLKVWLTGNS